MTVRLRLALIVFATGLITALGVVIALVVAFERFEHERTYDRANAFLTRVLATRDDLLEQHERRPEELVQWLQNLLLFEPGTQLYLLDAQGRVMSSTCTPPAKVGLQLALAPVQQAAMATPEQRMPYVMGDDPERMSSDAVIAARALYRSAIRPGHEAAGYLYLVAQQPRREAGRMERLRSSVAGPALLALLALIGITTTMAMWIVITVTRPLRQLRDEVAAAARDGFERTVETPALPRRDEFGQLQQGFHQLLATLRGQWQRLRELDQFRREGVSNLSHDLRSPLTATVAGLETLQQRWAGDGSRSADLQLVDVALRNTRNAAALVRSLGDLALLDEPSFRLDTVLVDMGELLDDITMRFAERAAQHGVLLRNELQGEIAPHAEVDIELFERAVANLLDNALKFTPRGGQITLAACVDDGRVRVTVADSGAGIAERDLPRLFDRLYQSRDSTAPASADEGKGLGLAIVKRIVELHGGSVAVHSAPGQGTVVTLILPRA